MKNLHRASNFVKNDVSNLAFFRNNCNLRNRIVDFKLNQNYNLVINLWIYPQIFTKTYNTWKVLAIALHLKLCQVLYQKVISQRLRSKQSNQTKVWSLSGTAKRHCIHCQKSWKPESLVLQSPTFSCLRSILEIKIPLPYYCELSLKIKHWISSQPTKMEADSISEIGWFSHLWPRTCISFGRRWAFSQAGRIHLCLFC